MLKKFLILKFIPFCCKIKKQKKKREIENVFFSARSIKGLEGGKNCVTATHQNSSKHGIVCPILHAKK